MSVLAYAREYPALRADDLLPSYDFKNYVALGDSYTAGPGIPEHVSHSCSRSNNNYPSKLSLKLNIETFIDVSCSGAQTSNIFDKSQTREGAVIEPQANAITNDTDLITIGVGGNDDHFFEYAIATCLLQPKKNIGYNPWEEKIRKIKANLLSIYERLHKDFPQATIVAIGYPRVMNSKAVCRDFNRRNCDGEFVEKVQRQLDEAIAESAKEYGIHFISLLEVTEGHEICSDSLARINGFHTHGDGSAFHPTAELMNLIANYVAKQISIITSM